MYRRSAAYKDTTNEDGNHRENRNTAQAGSDGKCVDQPDDERNDSQEDLRTSQKVGKLLEIGVIGDHICFHFSSISKSK